jgi:hypothetical protein
MRWLCCCHFSNRRVQPYNPPPGQPVPGAPWGSQLYGSDCHFIILFLNAFHSTVLTVCPTPPLFWIKQTMNQPSMIILGCIIYTYIYTYLVYIMCCIYIYTYIWRYIIYPYIYSIVSRVFMLCSKNVYVYNCIYIYIRIYRERESCRFIYLGICKSHLGPLCEVLFGHQLLGLRKQWGPRGPVATAFGSWKSCELLELHQEISFWGHEKTGRPRHAMITLISSP